MNKIQTFAGKFHLLLTTLLAVAVLTLGLLLYSRNSENPPSKIDGANDAPSGPHIEQAPMRETFFNSLGNHKAFCYEWTATNIDSWFEVEVEGKLKRFDIDTGVDAKEVGQGASPSGFLAWFIRNENGNESWLLRSGFYGEEGEVRGGVSHDILSPPQPDAKLSTIHTTQGGGSLASGGELTLATHLIKDEGGRTIRTVKLKCKAAR